MRFFNFDFNSIWTVDFRILYGDLMHLPIEC
jgi:hypothetical protein